MLMRLPPALRPRSRTRLASCRDRLPSFFVHGLDFEVLLVLRCTAEAKGFGIRHKRVPAAASLNICGIGPSGDDRALEAYRREGLSNDCVGVFRVQLLL